MAGWISSKLKVAETLLQQIDQQAAESLGKNDRPRSPPDSLSSSDAPKRSSSSSALPLKYQLPVKPPPPPPLPVGPDPDPDARPLWKPPPDPDVDWTELLGSPKSIASPARSNGASPSPPHRTKKPSPRRGSVKSPAAGVKNPPLRDPGSPPRQPGDSKRVEDGSCVLDGNVTYDGKSGPAVDNVSAASSSGSGSGSDSASSSDSEDERRRREERRKRRERVMAEKAAEAIKERENVVAKLEGEKESLEKILEERERQQAQEASELQTSMIETMEAVDLEKQKHNSTRMDALTRVAKLETTNTELARALATTQWNLEVEVTQVAELRQQIEAKELALEEHRRRMSKAHQGTRSLSEVESSKRAELEQEILDAEYSLICDKIAKLKEKAKNLEENIVITRNDIVRPTEVEVELKRRLAQLTDHLIQKQTQVEALSSEKATLVFRMETVSRLLNENSLPLQATDYIDELGSGVAGTSERADIEAGVWQPYNSAPRRALRDRIKSGQRQLGSILQQLDAIFASGLVFLKRNPKVQLLTLFYLVCLHLWVTYILMSRSEESNGASSGAVISLETINKTSGT